MTATPNREGAGNRPFSRPSIYVECAAAAGTGYDHGAWIVVESEDYVREEIQHLLDTSPAPVGDAGWKITDQEGFGGFAKALDFLPDALGDLVEAADLIARHGHVASAAASYAHDLIYVRALVQDHAGTFATAADWAEDHVDALYGDAIPESVWGYIDFEKMAEDAVTSGDLVIVENPDGDGVVVFWNV